jgi:carotenoid cleavage dioxygenase-like enzyme
MTAEHLSLFSALMTKTVLKNSDDLDDGGTVPSVLLGSNKGSLFLLVLDVKSFEEVARAELPHHIPIRIHGQFYGGINESS